jgi:glycine/D-amino acid oxidase-like deaminating enzyme
MGKAPKWALIVGAGIFGASISRRLARRGAAATLVDRAGPAAEAGGRSFGWINATFGKPEPYLRLRFQSLP